jgi:tRNA synthetases class II (D, K and N)/OB-fold nucleic acid binding domain
MNQYQQSASPPAPLARRQQPPSRVLAADLPLHVGEPVMIAGWVHRRRQLKSVSFLVIRDRSGLAQVVFTGPAAEALDAWPEETVVQVGGLAVASSQAPGGAEITGATLTALSGPAVAPPFGLYRPDAPAALPVILDNAGAALRHPLLRAPFELAAAAVAGFRGYLDGAGFTEIHTPKIVGTATESGANVFSLDYFGRTAFLAQSPQFYKQVMVGVFERVYEVGPVFRAERPCRSPPATTRAARRPAPGGTPGHPRRPRRAPAYPRGRLTARERRHQRSPPGPCRARSCGWRTVLADLHPLGGEGRPGRPAIVRPVLPPGTPEPGPAAVPAVRETGPDPQRDRLVRPLLPSRPSTGTRRRLPGLRHHHPPGRGGVVPALL